MIYQLTHSDYYLLLTMRNKFFLSSLPDWKTKKIQCSEKKSIGYSERRFNLQSAQSYSKDAEENGEKTVQRFESGFRRGYIKNYRADIIEKRKP